MSQMKRLMEDYQEVIPDLKKLTKHQKYTLMFFAGYNPSPLTSFTEDLFWDKLDQNIFFKRFVIVNHKKDFLKPLNKDSILYTKRSIQVKNDFYHMDCEMFMTMPPDEVEALANKAFRHLYDSRSKIQALDMIGKASRAIRRIGDEQ